MFCDENKSTGTAQQFKGWSWCKLSTILIHSTSNPNWVQTEVCSTSTVKHCDKCLESTTNTTTSNRPRDWIFSHSIQKRISEPLCQFNGLQLQAGSGFDWELGRSILSKYIGGESQQNCSWISERNSSWCEPRDCKRSCYFMASYLTGKRPKKHRYRGFTNRKKNLGTAMNWKRWIWTHSGKSISQKNVVCEGGNDIWLCILQSSSLQNIKREITQEWQLLHDLASPYWPYYVTSQNQGSI